MDSLRSEQFNCISNELDNLKVSKTLRRCYNGSEETKDWLNSSFPAMFRILEQENSDNDCSKHSSVVNNGFKNLKILCEQRLSPHSSNPSLLKCPNIPLYNLEEKFKLKVSSGNVKDSLEVHPSQGLPSIIVPRIIGKTCKSKRKKVLQPNKDNNRFCLAQYHQHHANPLTGILQYCSGSKDCSYKMINNNEREMDKVIENPEAFCPDSLESSCELKLPGAYSMARPVRELKFQPEKKGPMDVLGMFLLLVDTIYAVGAVRYANYKGNVIPYEFTQDIVRVVALVRAVCPETFNLLQKLLMYSQLSLITRKSPLKWNKCMIHVFEDLIVHPLPYIDEEVNFHVYKMVIYKRAMELFDNYTPDENRGILFNSAKHVMVMRNYFELQKHMEGELNTEQIAAFLRTSAANSQQGHRVKNIRFKVKDKNFQGFIKDVFSSYSS